MGLIKFLFFRKKEHSVLASKKYGKTEVNAQEKDKSILSNRKYGQEKNEQNKEI